jgi:hypothetical protein
MLGRMIVAIKIVPSRDGAYSEGDRAWHKKYASIPDATSEAVELEIMTAEDKRLLDDSQRQPTWPHGYAPTRSFKVDLGELTRRDFRLDD